MACSCKLVIRMRPRPGLWPGPGRRCVVCLNHSVRAVRASMAGPGLAAPAWLWPGSTVITDGLRGVLRAGVCGRHHSPASAPDGRS